MCVKRRKLLQSAEHGRDVLQLRVRFNNLIQTLGIESGGIHQVRPWFAGRLDFAPVVAFEGDAEFPLKGGTVEYFLDRQAAVFVYGHRLHTISLFVFRADGLPWPGAGLRTAARGFSVVLWRAGDLGYALVSDVDPATLERLAGRFRPGR